jgi:hypothetical protein
VKLAPTTALSVLPSIRLPAALVVPIVPIPVVGVVTLGSSRVLSRMEMPAFPAPDPITRIPTTPPGTVIFRFSTVDPAPFTASSAKPFAFAPLRHGTAVPGLQPMPSIVVWVVTSGSSAGAIVSLGSPLKTAGSNLIVSAPTEDSSAPSIAARKVHSPTATQLTPESPTLPSPVPSTVNSAAAAKLGTASATRAPQSAASRTTRGRTKVTPPS